MMLILRMVHSGDIHTKAVNQQPLAHTLTVAPPTLQPILDSDTNSSCPLRIQNGFCFFTTTRPPPPSQ